MMRTSTTPARKRPPIAYAFIDSQNLNMGVQKYGWKMDWRKFRAFLKERYNVTHAYMFIGYVPDYEDLYKQMHDAGYLVVLKPTLEMYQVEVEGAPAKPEPKAVQPDASGNVVAVEEAPIKPPTKGNVDAELVLYAMKELPHYDKALIVSGDGDFYCIVEYLAQQGKLLHILAPNRKYSSLFKPFEQFVVRLDEYKKVLNYRGYHKKSAR